MRRIVVEGIMRPSLVAFDVSYELIVQITMRNRANEAMDPNNAFDFKGFEKGMNDVEEDSVEEVDLVSMLSIDEDEIVLPSTAIM